MKPRALESLFLAATLGLLLAACETLPTDVLERQATNLPGDAQVCFYEDNDYQGASFCADEDSNWVGTGWNDRVSSLKVLDGFRVVLSEDIDFGGRSLELTQDTSTLPEFDDLVSSFKLSQINNDEDASNDEELTAKCTPKVEVEAEDLASEGATKLFNIYPEVYVMQLAPQVCRTLYGRAEEARAPQTIVFRIVNEPGGYPAWATPGLPVAHYYINTDHIRKFDRAEDVLEEFKGITAHELTHLYQNYDDGASAGLTEGIADYVRFQLGFTPPGAQPDKGGNWDDGYRTTAFFLTWIEQTTPDFVRKLNLAIAGDYFDTETAFKDLTGKTPEELWDDYSSDDSE